MTPSEPNLSDNWYYEADGARIGPVAGERIQKLIEEKRLDGDTKIWREGMKDWTAVRYSEFGTSTSEPPPLPASSTSSFLVWIVAILPVVFGAINASIAQQNVANQIWSNMIGAKFEAVSTIPIFALALINAMLCLWDAAVLKRAGYNVKLIGAFLVGLVLVPAYLFGRSQVLRQRPIPALAWLVAAIIGAMM